MKAAPLSVERIERAIVVLRDHKVMLDADLARLYEVPTKVLVQAVKRNADVTLAPAAAGWDAGWQISVPAEVLEFTDPVSGETVFTLIGFVGMYFLLGVLFVLTFADYLTRMWKIY